MYNVFLTKTHMSFSIAYFELQMLQVFHYLYDTNHCLLDMHLMDSLTVVPEYDVSHPNDSCRTTNNNSSKQTTHVFHLKNYFVVAFDKSSINCLTLFSTVYSFNNSARFARSSSRCSCTQSHRSTISFPSFTISSFGKNFSAP